MLALLVTSVSKRDRLVEESQLCQSCGELQQRMIAAAPRVEEALLRRGSLGTWGRRVGGGYLQGTRAKAV